MQNYTHKTVEPIAGDGSVQTVNLTATDISTSLYLDSDNDTDTDTDEFNPHRGEFLHILLY